MSLNALISIHDVCPETLSRVEKIIALLPEPCKAQLLLLVIPGKAWSTADLQKLHQFQDQGFELAGHGWTHKCKKIQGIYHKLHAALISRDCAEHLALSNRQIKTLLIKNHAWFEENGLKAPEYYVPPAWAMGKISRRELNDMPFRFFESQSGIYDSQGSRFIKLPVVGFEADNTFRKICLLAWNSINCKLASKTQPARIGIHPYDCELLLASSMTAILEKVVEPQPYKALFAQTSRH